MRPEISTRSVSTIPSLFFHASKLLPVLLALLVLSFFPSRINAHQLTVGECKEASDFIKNAAIARDNGVVEESFMSRISDDIEVIRSFPQQLRWFVQDDDDARFLLSAAANVFKHPKAARAHQADFFNNCMSNAKASDTLHRYGSM
jgi:hypothetical protein